MTQVSVRVHDSVYTQYQTIRYKKFQLLSQHPTRSPNLGLFKAFLEQQLSHVLNCRIRLHCQMLGSIQSEDIMVSPISRLFKLLTSLAQPFQLQLIYQDQTHGVEVWELGCTQQTLTHWCQVPTVFQCMKVVTVIEVQLTMTTGQRQYQVFLGDTTKYHLAPHYFLIPLEHWSYAVPSQTVHAPAPELLDLWIALLKYRWQWFWVDVTQRECALECWRDGTWYIRRKFAPDQPAIFTHPTDLHYLKQYQVSNIIPNIHAWTAPTEIVWPLEAVIDLDPGPTLSLSDVIEISDLFSLFLSKQQFRFYRRLTAGTHSGQHFIIPLDLQPTDYQSTDQPLPLTLPLLSHGMAPQSYFTRLLNDVYINALRESVMALVLYFFVTMLDKHQLQFVTLRADIQKLRFDCTRNARNSGRRALYSLHPQTNRIVIPLPSAPIATIDQYQTYWDWTALDQAWIVADQLVEPLELRSPAIRKANAQQLVRVAQLGQPVWEAYHTVSPLRFQKLLQEWHQA